ncbi:hypothetical protein HPB50_021618 [Hyalomma asiaticum]|uniref:Uncharacterized protein n=1 Tax=Hyalomma asiaticum TaxID=266040 RepID=A0ACB7SXW3_HYAAI|nr:hypothetical protein HPB50_021618 [Hyalomma asiaticum]
MEAELKPSVVDFDFKQCYPVTSALSTRFEERRCPSDARACASDRLLPSQRARMLFHVTSCQKRHGSFFLARCGETQKKRWRPAHTVRARVCGRHYKGDTLAHTAGVARCMVSSDERRPLSGQFQESLIIFGASFLRLFSFSEALMLVKSVSGRQAGRRQAAPAVWRLCVTTDEFSS